MTGDFLADRSVVGVLIVINFPIIEVSGCFGIAGVVFVEVARRESAHTQTTVIAVLSEEGNSETLSN